MAVEIRVPPLGESVVEATVGRWTKKEGDRVEKDEILVELETDKITVEVAAQAAGIIEKIAKAEGDTVSVNELLGSLSASDGATPSNEAGQTATARYEEKPAAPQPAAEAAPAAEGSGSADAQTSPAVRSLVAEHGLNVAEIRGSGPNGRVTKEDVLAFIERGRAKSAEPAAAAPAAPSAPAPAPAPKPAAAAPAAQTGGRETRERMSRRRKTIARRLVEAQQTTASLTTFNEVDLKVVMELRKARQDEFVKKHGVKLGFMSFFTKARSAR